jgi:hypothetical protein
MILWSWLSHRLAHQQLQKVLRSEVAPSKAEEHPASDVPVFDSQKNRMV